MKLDKQKAFTVFFGNPELPEGNIIITPITKIYNEIGVSYPLLAKSKGWWQMMKVHIGLSIATVFKIPPGSHINDVLAVFDKNKIRKVILLGYCGALKPNLKIGNIIIPTIASLRNLKTKTSFYRKKVFKITTVSQMILEEAVLKALQKKKIDLVDMETYFMYHWGRLNNIPTVSILVVTDYPPSYPFFLCRKEDFRLINRSILKLVRNLKKFL